MTEEIIQGSAHFGPTSEKNEGSSAGSPRETDGSEAYKVSVEEANEAIVEAYDAIRRMVDKYIPAVVEHHKDDKSVLANTLKLHRELMSQMRQADTVLETALIDAGIDYGGEMVEGAGLVAVRRSGAKTRYDNPALISRIAATLADDVGVDSETGEIPPPAVAVQLAVARMADLAGCSTKSFSSWRKGEAGRLGIDLSNYCEKEGGRLTVTIQ